MHSSLYSYSMIFQFKVCLALSALFSLFCHRSEPNCWSSSWWKCPQTSANFSVHLLNFCQHALHYCISLLILPICFWLGSRQVQKTLTTGWLALLYDQISQSQNPDAFTSSVRWARVRLSIQILCEALIPWADLADSRKARAHFLLPQPSTAFSCKNYVARQICHHCILLAKMEEN